MSVRASPAVVAVAVATLAGCVASEAPNLPPPIGTPTDGGLPDVTAGPDIQGPCPGRGSVSVSFDRGKATETCWSAYSPLAEGPTGTPPSQSTVTLSGNPASYPGLSVAITLLVGTVGKTVCAFAAGSKVPLGGPCVLVAVGYESASGRSEWRAFGGGAAAIGGEAPATSAAGSLTVDAFGTTLGATVSVSFSPGSELVLDAPGHPFVGIAGSASAPLQ